MKLSWHIKKFAPQTFNIQSCTPKPKVSAGNCEAVSWHIRKTTMADIESVMVVYSFAQNMMAEYGNCDQWGTVHPPRALIEEDIRIGQSYVCVSGDEILAVFMVSTIPDPTYDIINGAWLDDKPYAVVHRIARGRNGKGAGEFCLNWCFKEFGNVRIDTHEANLPMITLLKRLGYEYCGIIWIENGDERLAYQKR